MKALILAAGFGTRLLPYTLTVPKPLFTLMSKPVLGHCIEQLVNMGCSQIIINTHYLHKQIREYIKIYQHSCHEQNGFFAKVCPQCLEDEGYCMQCINPNNKPDEGKSNDDNSNVNEPNDDNCNDRADRIAA